MFGLQPRAHAPAAVGFDLRAWILLCCIKWHKVAGFGGLFCHSCANRRGRNRCLAHDDYGRNRAVDRSQSTNIPVLMSAILPCSSPSPIHENEGATISGLIVAQPAPYATPPPWPSLCVAELHTSAIRNSLRGSRRYDWRANARATWNSIPWVSAASRRFSIDSSFSQCTQPVSEPVQRLHKTPIPS
jgi:hypothetical protein